MLEAVDVEDDIVKNRKLLGRILIKGDSNITSATISKDGAFLVVSTNSDVKAFHLTIGNSKSKEEIRIRKVDVPAPLARLGASAVQLSPDCKWLTIIQDGTTVLITKIIRDEESEESQITLHSRASKLDRLKRKIPKHVLLGGLKNYERRIGHVAFSADSKMLATADLAGFIDTWVLRDPDLQNGASAEEEDDASSSSSSSSDGSDDEMGMVEAGPRWVRNPKARLIPKLPASPVVLSFSDDVPGDSLKGRADYTLLAITIGTRLFLFHPLSGSLTSWARKNPHSSLPEQVRIMRDVPKGVLWQGSRLWIYGVSYIFMLDLSQDFSQEESTALIQAGQKNGTKRKRGPDSGAGNRMAQAEALYPHQVKKATEVDGDKKEQWVDVEMTDAEEDGGATSGDPEDEDDDDEDETEGGELQLLRNGQGSADAGDKAKASGLRRKWWHTYKFRPILGIVPLESQDHGEETSGAVQGRETGDVPPLLEVALVERPIWDVDLPPRYFGEDEYER